MNKLKNLSIRMKIMLMLTLPLIGLIYFSVVSVMEKSAVVHEMEAISPLAQLAVKASSGGPLFCSTQPPFTPF